MSGNVFIPKMEHVKDSEREEETIIHADDTGTFLQKVGQYTVVLLAGLLPIWFVPGLWASLGLDKTLLAIVATVLVVFTASLLTLRRTSIRTVLPLTLGLFWLLVLSAFVSGILSGDSQDALRGSVMETHTAGFLAVLGLMMTIPLVLQGSKIMTVRALAFFGLTGALLLVYNLARIILDASFLSLGSFQAVTTSPIGSFNDLAIFSGLIIILSLVTLAQLPIRAWLQIVISVLVFCSLVLLAVVNFFNIWLVVGFFSLLLLLYLLSRDTLFKNPESKSVAHPRLLIVTTTIVCIVSAVFIVTGDYVGEKINSYTNINYVEVRPSAKATIAIAQAVYLEDPYLGTGPNRFADAWRQHKDPSINQTIFWDTDFNAGSGYIPTLFVTTGLVGGILVAVFHLWFLRLGYRMLLRNTTRDPYWYYFGVVSFAAACFIWGMSYIYVPGAAILLLGALFTGFSFVAAAALLPESVRSIQLAVSRQRGFFLMAVIIILITVSIGALFTVGKQYVAQARFAEAQATATTVSAIEQAAEEAYRLYPDAGFVSARAQVQLTNLNALLGVTDPSEEQQQDFLRTAEQALGFAEQAVADDMTNPDYHAVLAGVYSALAVAGIEGAHARATNALLEAKQYDPINPGYHLLGAQLAARTGDLALAREEISTALALKRNFTQALYLSAQLDIGEGNAESAIATTRAIITLEPKNPTRYFQLGVLLSASDQLPEAIAAFQSAITLDPQYANARYLLALAYLNNDNSAAALEQLRFVQQTNPQNQQLVDLIQQVETGEYQAPEKATFEAPVNDTVPSQIGDAVITEDDVDIDLVSPVNTVSEVQSEEAELGGTDVAEQEY